VVSCRDLVELVSPMNELLLESGDQELRGLREVKYELCNSASVLSIQGVVKLIHDVEGSRINLEDGEEEGSSHHGLLPSREVPEALNIIQVLPLE